MRTARFYVAVFWLVWLVIAVAQSQGFFGFVLAFCLGSFALPIVCYLWCKADCAARAVQAPNGAIPMILVLLPIGWAYYLFSTRPRSRAWVTVAGTVVLATIVLVIAHVVLGSAGHAVT